MSLVINDTPAATNEELINEKAAAAKGESSFHMEGNDLPDNVDDFHLHLITYSGRILLDLIVI